MNMSSSNVKDNVSDRELSDYDEDHDDITDEFEVGIHIILV